MAFHCEGCKIMETYKYWNDAPPGKKHRVFKFIVVCYANRNYKTLTIPKKFIECLKKEELRKWCTLRGPSGSVWRVQIERTCLNETVLSEGWGSFVKDLGLSKDIKCDVNPYSHSYSYGSSANSFILLEFSYYENSTFEVSVFDHTTQCEREETHFAMNSSLLPSPMMCSSSLHTHSNNENSNNVNNGSIHIEEITTSDDDDDDENDVGTLLQICGPGPTPGGRRTRTSNNGKKRKTPSHKQCQTIYISNRRQVTNQEKQRAFKLANGYVLENPHAGIPRTTITMLPTHVYTSFNLTIPKEWAWEHMNPGNHNVELRVPGIERSWVVGCKWTQSQCQLTSPQWPIFVLQTNLEEDDVCVFELLNKGEPRRKMNSIINVHIFRVVEKVVPVSVTTCTI